MSCRVMSQVHESCHRPKRPVTYECVFHECSNHVYERIMLYSNHMQVSHTYGWVYNWVWTPIHIGRATNTGNILLHTAKTLQKHCKNTTTHLNTSMTLFWVMAHIWISHVTCHTYSQATSYIYLYLMPHVSLRIKHVPYAWVFASHASHMNTACQMPYM